MPHRLLSLSPSWLLGRLRRGGNAAWLLQPRPGSHGPRRPKATHGESGGGNARREVVVCPCAVCKVCCFSGKSDSLCANVCNYTIKNASTRIKSEDSAHVSGLKIRVSVVRFRPRPPVFMRPSARFGSWGVSTIRPILLQKAVMGSRKAARLKFLALHPRCCFCGGVTPATTEDHIPARALFLKRWWPEGYVFPACERCNRDSADNELFMAVLVRMRVRASTTEEDVERRKAIAGLRARYPDFLANIERMSRIETRQRADAAGRIDWLNVNVADVVGVRIPLKAFAVAEHYGEKLGKALHYLHTDQILPATGSAWARFIPNSVDKKKEIPAELTGPFATAPVASVRRGSTRLNDQFEYQFLIIEGGAASCFLVSFGDSLTLILVNTRERDAALSEAERTRLSKSFSGEA